MAEHKIVTRFEPGDDVALAIHADHPEDGRPQLMRVVWVMVEIQSSVVLIAYHVRIRGLRGTWKGEQDFLIGERTRAGYVLVAEEELVPWAVAEDAYRVYREKPAEPAPESKE